MITTKQKFVHFMKQNNAYEKYLHNYKSDKIYRISFFSYQKEVPFNYFITKTRKESFISCAFDWEKTKEGWAFWNSLSYKWRRYIYPQAFNLIDFLEENNAYKQYIYNFKHGLKDYDQETFLVFADTYNQKNHINYAFDWDETKEGFDYWNNINAKWIDSLDDD